MTLLREIQAVATDSTVEISTVLRKAKILAARLQNPEFETWVDRELNGYAGGSDLPPYRKLPTAVRGTLSNGHQLWNNAPIMTSFLPENLSGWGECSSLYQPISEIASMAKGRHDWQLPWPQELAVHFGAKGYNRFECLGAWQLINRSALVGVVEQVRNRVLEFALKIEAAAPQAGETLIGDPAPIPQEKIAQIFNTYVYGDANNVAAGGSQVSQHSTSGIMPGDIESLLGHLRELGIANEDLKALKQATDSQANEKTALEGWLGKLAMSAATGATTTAISMAAKAIAVYLGVHVS